jgi:hypothetical protein
MWTSNWGVGLFVSETEPEIRVKVMDFVTYAVLLEKILYCQFVMAFVVLTLLYMRI